MFRKWLSLMSVIGLLAASAQAEARSRFVHTYATCYNLWGSMRDGSYTRPRTVASNALSLGTRIRLVGPRSFLGVRKFVVRDTGGALGDGHLDIWYGTPRGNFASCSLWGQRPVTYKIGWRK